MSTKPKLINIYMATIYGQEVPVKVYSSVRPVEEHEEEEEGPVLDIDGVEELPELWDKDVAEILQEIEQHVETIFQEEDQEE